MQIDEIWLVERSHVYGSLHVQPLSRAVQSAQRRLSRASDVPPWEAVFAGTEKDAWEFANRVRSKVAGQHDERKGSVE